MKKLRIDSGNARCHSFRNPLSTRFLFKNMIKISLSVVLCGCGTWSLAQWEECKRCAQNIWTQDGGVKGGWRKIHNEEIHNLYS